MPLGARRPHHLAIRYPHTRHQMSLCHKQHKTITLYYFVELLKKRLALLKHGHVPYVVVHAHAIVKNWPKYTISL